MNIAPIPARLEPGVEAVAPISMPEAHTPTAQRAFLESRWYRAFLKKMQRVGRWLDDDTECSSPGRPGTEPSSHFEGVSDRSLRPDDSASNKLNLDSDHPPLRREVKLEHATEASLCSINTQSRESPVAKGDKKRQGVMLIEEDNLEVVPRFDESINPALQYSSEAYDRIARPHANAAISSMAVVQWRAPRKDPGGSIEIQRIPSAGSKEHFAGRSSRQLPLSDGIDKRLARNGPSKELPQVNEVQQSAGPKQTLRTKLSKILTGASLDTPKAENESIGTQRASGVISRILTPKARRKARPASLPLKQTQQPRSPIDRKVQTAPLSYRDAAGTPAALEHLNEWHSDLRWDQLANIEAEYAELEHGLQLQLQGVREKRRALQREKDLRESNWWKRAFGG